MNTIIIGINDENENENEDNCNCEVLGFDAWKHGRYGKQIL